jgi:putative DNA primase/helicase
MARIKPEEISIDHITRHISDEQREALAEPIGEKCRALRDLLRDQPQEVKLFSELIDYLYTIKEPAEQIKQLVAEYLVENHHFKTTRENKELYYYEDGLYRDSGDVFVQVKAGELLDSKCTETVYKDILFRIKRMTYVSIKDFEPPLHLVPVNNGIFDLNADRLLDFDPKYLFTHKIPVNYDPTAECPHINQFLVDICPTTKYDQPDFQVLSTLQEIPSYCLYRRYAPMQKIIFLFGSGENGKSKYLELVENVLGFDNITSITPQDLSGNRFAGAEMYQKLANICGDIPKDGLKNFSVLRKYSGEDLVTAEKKNKNPFGFRNHAKMVYSCNELPTVGDDTDGTWRRVLVLDFPMKFVDDPDPDEANQKKADREIIHKLLTEEELSGFLNKIIFNLKKILKSQRFSYNPSIAETRESYRMRSDSVSVFSTKCLVDTGIYDDIEFKDDIYDHYERFCKKFGFMIAYRDVFFRDLNKLLSRAYATKASKDDLQKNCYRGLLIDQEYTTFSNLFLINRKEKNNKRNKNIKTSRTKGGKPGKTIKDAKKALLDNDEIQKIENLMHALQMRFKIVPDDIVERYLKHKKTCQDLWGEDKIVNRTISGVYSEYAQKYYEEVENGD